MTSNDLIVIGPGDGFSAVQRAVIIWTNAGLL